LLDVIDHFRKGTAFLSNFYRRKILYKGHWYPSSEHIYHAEKSFDEEYKNQLMVQKEIDMRNNKEYLYFKPELTPVESKNFGNRSRLIKAGLLRSDWFDVSFELMEDINIYKFVQNPDLRKKLMDTGNKILIEGNYWNDKFWGMVKYNRNDPNSEWVGENHLGKILMNVRTRLRDDIDNYQSPCPKCGSYHIDHRYVNCKCHTTNDDGTSYTCWSHPICEDCGLIGYANSKGSYWGDQYTSLWEIKNK